MNEQQIKELIEKLEKDQQSILQKANIDLARVSGQIDALKHVLSLIKADEEE